MTYYIDDYNTLCQCINLNEEVIDTLVKRTNNRESLFEHYECYLSECKAFNKSPMLFEEYIQRRNKAILGFRIGCNNTINESIDLSISTETQLEYAEYCEKMRNEGKLPLNFDAWVLDRTTTKGDKLKKTAATAGILAGGAYLVDKSKKNKDKTDYAFYYENMKKQNLEPLPYEMWSLIRKKEKKDKFKKIALTVGGVAAAGLVAKHKIKKHKIEKALDDAKKKNEPSDLDKANERFKQSGKELLKNSSNEFKKASKNLVRAGAQAVVDKLS